MSKSSGCQQIHLQSKDSVDTFCFGNVTVTFTVKDGENVLIESGKLKTKTPDYQFQSFLLDVESYNPTMSTNLNEEIVDWISADGLSVVKPLPRKMIHKYNLYHRGIGVIIVDKSTGRIFIHQRSPNKRIFPSMFDMFVGGVCSSNEMSEFTLKRELLEEVGLDVNNTIVQCEPLPALKEFLLCDHNAKDSLELLVDFYVRRDPTNIIDNEILYVGSTSVLTDYNHCLVSCYVLIASSSLLTTLKYADGEIIQGEWLSMKRIYELVGDGNKSFGELRNDYVPDGLLVWDRLNDLVSSFLHLSNT